MGGGVVARRSEKCATTTSVADIKNLRGMCSIGGTYRYTLPRPPVWLPVLFPEARDRALP